MRKAILAVLAASGLAAFSAAPAEAVGTRYPFCLQGDEYPGLSYCTFTSYERVPGDRLGTFSLLHRQSLLCQPEANRHAPRIARCPAARCRPPPAAAGTDHPPRVDCAACSRTLTDIQRANVI